MRWKLPKLSIAAQWALRYTAATWLVLGSIGFLLYTQISEVVLSGADFELRRHVSQLSELLARGNPSEAELANVIEAIIASSDPAERLAIEVYAGDGRIVVSRDILAPFAEPPPSLPSPPETLSYQVQRRDPYPFFVFVSGRGRLPRPGRHLRRALPSSSSSWPG